VAVRLGKLLRVAGMSAVYGVGQSLARAGLDLHSLDEGVRRSSVEQAKKYVDEAYLIGARLMDLNPGKDPGPEHRERAKEAAVESLTRLCEYAASRATDYVLPLSMENFDRELDKKLLLGPTAETIEVVAAVRRRCPNMGITI
jgi:hydroxypyruvate isomerase